MTNTATTTNHEALKAQMAEWLLAMEESNRSMLAPGERLNLEAAVDAAMRTAEGHHYNDGAISDDNEAACMAVFVSGNPAYWTNT
jgi:hypothetical protein